jgi:hypothetical protein
MRSNGKADQSAGNIPKRALDVQFLTQHSDSASAATTENFAVAESTVGSILRLDPGS